MRLRGFVRKEWLQVMRDPSSLAIAFALPVILLIIFGYGISLDARHVPVAIVIEAPGPEASSFAGGFYNSPYFVPVPMRSIQDATEALNKWEVKGIIWIRNNFARDYLNRESPPVSVIVNGIDANTARLVEGYVAGVWAQWLAFQAIKSGKALSLPVNLDYRIWFNPAVRSRNFLVPGLFAIIMTLIGALLTALIIAREWERGTMEALLVTPVTVREMLLGKIAPYFIHILL
jgi:ABC-2 type transport system permease protein